MRELHDSGEVSRVGDLASWVAEPPSHEYGGIKKGKTTSNWTPFSGERSTEGGRTLRFL